jgi:hypothetical protein
MNCSSWILIEVRQVDSIIRCDTDFFLPSVVAGSHLEFMNVAANHRRHPRPAEDDNHVDADDSSQEKPTIAMYEQATGNSGAHKDSQA